MKSETKKERQAQEILESTTRFTEGRFEVGLLWNKPNAKLPNNYSAALGNLKSLERRLSKDPQLKQMYQDTIDKDEEKGQNFRGALSSMEETNRTQGQGH